ncbi:sterigmatocystin 8-O-methyltransferase [Colletotrichum tofieldiae]|uniref:Sterigmatocystin 8-O-methyltransferase n=1 Tax=Colletotrichum tofieldiae TaxID=708197 RepID=A0A166W6T0_9PEZI|nr:sterigmatocystin 8-O-methyltransferase [Colletotrichum tofieldiae]
MSLGLPVIVGSYACIVGGCWDVFGSFPTYLTKHEWSILGRRPMQDVVSKYSNFFKHMVSDYPNGEIQNHYEQEYDIMDGRRIFPHWPRLGDELCGKHPHARGQDVLQDLSHVLLQTQKIASKIEPTD